MPKATLNATPQRRLGRCTSNVAAKEGRVQESLQLGGIRFGPMSLALPAGAGVSCPSTINYHSQWHATSRHTTRRQECTPFLTCFCVSTTELQGPRCIPEVSGETPNNPLPNGRMAALPARRVFTVAKLRLHCMEHYSRAPRSRLTYRTIIVPRLEWRGRGWSAKYLGCRLLAGFAQGLLDFGRLCCSILDVVL